MAGPNQSDQLGELSLAMLDLYRSSGLAGRRAGWAASRAGWIAKQCGTTPAEVQDWLSGAVTPLPGQALALVRALRMADGVPAGGLAGGDAA